MAWMIAPSDWKCCHSTRYPLRLNISPAMNSGRLARRGEIAPIRTTAGEAAEAGARHGSSPAATSSATAAAEHVRRSGMASILED